MNRPALLATLALFATACTAPEEVSQGPDADVLEAEPQALLSPLCGMPQMPCCTGRCMTGLACISGRCVPFVPIPPVPPSNVTVVPSRQDMCVSASDLLPSFATVSWRDNSNNETGFRVERLNGGSWSVVAAVGPGTTTAQLRLDRAPALYTVRVLAINNYGVAPSGPATLDCLPPPAAPSNLRVASVEPYRVGLAWNDNSGDETGFALSGTPGPISFPANTTAGNAVNLSPGTAYTLAIRACRSTRCSAWSAPVSVTTAPLPRPSRPEQLQVWPLSATSLQLQWIDNNASPHGIRIAHSTDGITFDESYFVAANFGDVSSQDIDLGPASIHYYRIRFSNPSGDSQWSEPAHAWTWATSAPATPANLTATPTAASVIRLSFTDTSSNELGFALSIAAGAGGPWNEWALVESLTQGQIRATGRTVLVDVTDLPPGTQRCFRVRSANLVSGQEAFSAGFTNVACATTPVSSGATTTRFKNDSSYPVISLLIDNQEQLPNQAAIAPGAYMEKALPAGSHNYSATTGFWQDDGSRFDMYTTSGSFVQSTNLTGLVSIANPTMGQLLTQFSPSGVGYWVGSVWNGTTIGSEGFCFRRDGSWSAYRDGVRTGASGTATTVSYPGSFMVTFQLDPGARTGIYEEHGSSFMLDGPYGSNQFLFDGTTCP